MKERYLITAIGGDIGSSVARCMWQAYGEGDLVGCDITPYVAGYDYVNGFFLAPPYKEGLRYIEAIYAECIKRDITCIMPMTEGEIRLFDSHRERFHDAGIKLMINDHHILATSFSKYKTAKMVRGLGLPSPRTWYPGEVMDGLDFPVVIKSDTGCGSRSVKIAYDPPSLESSLQQTEDGIIQEYIGTEDEEYTAGVFSDGTDILSIAFKRSLGFGGMSVRVERVMDPRIQEICERVAGHLQLRGAINIQMRKQDGDYYVFEINPRISSTVGFRYQLGFKDVEWWLDLLDGKREKIKYVDERTPMVGIRVLGERIFKEGIGQDIDLANTWIEKEGSDRKGGSY